MRRELATFGIENDGANHRDEREARAEFRGAQSNDTGTARLRVEKGLPEGVVAAVQEHAGPNVARFQSHPGKRKLIPSAGTVKHLTEYHRGPAPR